jgi:hypothetical protein
MATFTELQTIAADTAFGLRLSEACLNVAKVILSEATPTAPRKQFLRALFANPVAIGPRLMWPLLVINQDSTAAQITGATDAAIESAVSSGINTIFAD